MPATQWHSSELQWMLIETRHLPAALLFIHGPSLLVMGHLTGLLV